MSNTPRTDASEYKQTDSYPPEPLGMVDVKFARQLERELNEANRRIKELESEGDRAIEFARQGSKTCADAVWYRVRNKP